MTEAIVLAIATIGLISIALWERRRARLETKDFYTENRSFRGSRRDGQTRPSPISSRVRHTASLKQPEPPAQGVAEEIPQAA